MSQIYKTPKGTELPILNLRGKEYLEVKYRLVWFREEHPDWTIETELVSRTATETIAKATIRDEKGRIVATSHKVEDKQGFGDHTEKAETGAIGRALALIGYGTQFCADEMDEGHRIVDAPVQRKTSPAPVRNPKFNPNYDDPEDRFVKEPEQLRAEAMRHEPSLPGSVQVADMFPEDRGPVNSAPQTRGGVSEAQIKRLYAIAKKHNWNMEGILLVLKKGLGISRSSELNRKQYDVLTLAIDEGANQEQVIDKLKSLQ